MKTNEQLRAYHRAYMRKYRDGTLVRRVPGIDPVKAKATSTRYQQSEKGKATRKRFKSTPEQREKARIAAHLRRKVPPPTRIIPDFCECCGRPPNGRGLFHLDHCHETDIFRGWLCFKCNSGIGNLGDSIEGVEQALGYLRRAYSIQSNAELSSV